VTARRKEKQLCLAVRRYRVSGWGNASLFECDAGSPGQARWKAYKAAREAGYFRAGFRAFMAAGFRVREVRR